MPTPSVRRAIVCLLLLPCGILSAQEAAAATPLVLKRAATAPTIDGVPDEECWKQADWRPLRSISGGALPVGGMVALCYDDQNLYVAYRLDEPTPAQMKAPQVELNSPDLWDGEVLEWFINPAPDGATYRQLAWNPAGSRFNAVCTATGGGAAKTDLGWKPAWKTGAHVEGKGWTSEAMIPFAELGQKAPATGSRWTVNPTRTRKIGGLEYSCLSPTGGGFHTPERFAEVWFGAYQPTDTTGIIVADPKAPLRALVGCWDADHGYDILVDGAAQLERALGPENVDIRIYGFGAAGWPRNYRELAGYALIVLEQLPTAAFSERLLADLRRYVQDGGHLVVTGVPYEVKDTPPLTWENTPFKDLLPVRAGGMLRQRQTIDLRSSDHPLLKGIASATPFSVWVDLTCAPGDGAQIIAVTTAASGATIPFLSERTVGKGRVLHVNVTGSTVMPAEELLRSNDFCRSVTYPLFWDNLVSYLTGRPVPHPAAIVQPEKPSRLWFDILTDNHSDIFRPDGRIAIAAPLDGDATYPCEVTAVIEAPTGASMTAGTYRLADKTAGFTVPLPGLDRGAYQLRLELRQDGAVVDTRRCRFSVALPLVSDDEFSFSPCIAPFMSEGNVTRVAADFAAMGFTGIWYPGGIVVDGGYAGFWRPYAEGLFLSRMQEAGIRTRPCWYPNAYYVMLPKGPNHDYTTRKPKLPDTAFPGKDYLPYAAHWMDAFDHEYWGKMPLTDGAVIGDELTAMWIPLTERLAKGYQAVTGRPAPDGNSPDSYNLMQYRLHLGGDFIWLARSAWEARNPGSIFDSVITPNSFAGHTSCLINVPDTCASLGCPSPDEYHYGEAKFYRKTLLSAAVTHAATGFGSLAKPAFTGGQLNNDYFMDFPEQVFASLSAGCREFHVFAFGTTNFEKFARQDPVFAGIAKRTTADAARIGRTLNHYQRNRARVAMLYPHTAHLWLSMGKAFNTDYLNMTGGSEDYLGLTYALDVEFDLLRRTFGHADILFDEQIRQGALQDYDVFVLAYSRQTEARTLREIRRFVDGGGTLLVASDSGRLDELNAPTGILADILPAMVGDERTVPTDYAETRLVKRDLWSRGNALQPKDGAERLFAFPDQVPACVRGKVGNGEIIVLGEPLAALKASPDQLTAIVRALTGKAKLVSRPDDGEFSAITFTAPRDRTRMFMVANHRKADATTTVRARGDEAEATSVLADIVSGEKVPFTVKDGVLSFELAVKDRWGRALALLERPPVAIEASVSAPTATPGDEFMLLVRLLGKDGLPVRATLPCDIQITDPTGKVRDDLSGVRVAENGVHVFTWRWPVAAAAGTWTLRASERISGASDTATWTSR